MGVFDVSEKPTVLVLDETGERVGVTYMRRACQLVSQNRAQWLDAEQTTVRLCSPKKTERNDFMAYEGYNANEQSGGEHEIERYEEPRYKHPAKRGRRDREEFYSPAEIDAELYEMAKQRVAERYHLVMHLGAYVSCSIMMAICAGVFWRIAPPFGMAVLGWGVGMFMHIMYYFAKANPDKIVREYDKLKRKMR
jgi:hypothetical protein